jgi:hypothetical protein
LSEGLKEWVADIQETEKRSEEAAEQGLKLLEDQIEGLEVMSDDIIDAARKQAILTLQYGVPYIPYAGDQWRIDLENGTSDEALKKLTGLLTNQVATVTGVPQTVVNASIESKTGVKTGPSIGDQITGIIPNHEKIAAMLQPEGEDKTETDGANATGGDSGSSGGVEMVAVEINDNDEVKVAEVAEQKIAEDYDQSTTNENENGNDSPPIMSEQDALLAEWRAPKQPEEYWYENHMCCFKFLFIMCALNIMLAIASIMIPI